MAKNKSKKKIQETAATEAQEVSTEVIENSEMDQQDKATAEFTQVEELPQSIRIVQDFRINLPLPGRKDVYSISFLKSGELITDKYLIKNLIKLTAPFSDYFIIN